MTPSNPMSLEQVRDWHRSRQNEDRSPGYCDAHRHMADAIDAELKRRESEAKDADRWRCFVKGLRGRFPGAGHGHRIKVVEICPMYGEEKEVDNIASFIDTAMSAESREGKDHGRV